MAIKPSDWSNLLSLALDWTRVPVTWTANAPEDITLDRTCTHQLRISRHQFITHERVSDKGLCYIGNSYCIAFDDFSLFLDYTRLNSTNNCSRKTKMKAVFALLLVTLAVTGSYGFLVPGLEQYKCPVNIWHKHSLWSMMMLMMMMMMMMIK